MARRDVGPTGVRLLAHLTAMGGHPAAVVDLSAIRSGVALKRVAGAGLLVRLSYDIVTRFTAKIPRSYCGVTGEDAAAAQAAEATGPGAGEHADVAHAGMREV